MFIQEMCTLREKSVPKSLCGRRSRTNVYSPFNKHKRICVFLSVFGNHLLNSNTELFWEIKQVFEYDDHSNTHL